MWPILIALSVGPLMIVSYAIGKSAGDKRARHNEFITACLIREVDETEERYQDAIDEWTHAASLLDRVNRKLADCVCGQRLSQQQEAVVIAALSDASIIDWDEARDGE